MIWSLVINYKFIHMKKTLLLLMIAGFFTLVSCKKDTSEPVIETPTSTDQLVVPASFDWKTTQEVQFNLKGFANSNVEISSETDAIFLKLGLKANQLVSANLSLPAFQKKVFLKYLGQNIEVDITGGTVSHTFTINSK